MVERQWVLRDYEYSKAKTSQLPKRELPVS